MLGLGSNASKSLKAAAGKWIITDNLVLRHDYRLHPVRPLSDGAAVFDGTDDYIDCGNGASLQIGDVDTTYTAWVKSNGGSSEYIISKRDDSNGAQSLFLNSAGKLMFISGTNENSVSNTALNDGLWHHVAVVYDQSEDDCFYYLDGVADGSDTSVGTTNHDDNSPVYIGFRESGDAAHHFDGYICNVGFFSAALTQAQIKSIMWKDYAGLSASEKTNLVSWWNLDSVIPDTTTLVYDNHHGDGNTLGSELIANSDFTANITGWDGYDGVWSNTAGADGTAGNMLITTRSPGGAWGYVYHTETILTVGKSYRLSFWFKKGEGTAGGIFLAGTSNLGGQYAAFRTGYADDSLGTSTSWTYFEKYFTATHATIHLNPTSSTGAFPNTAYFDDISIKEVNGNTGTLG